MPKYVYDFTEGDRRMTGLLGGKGAGLAEMTRLGLPVPAGFTLTTEACRVFLAMGGEPPGLGVELAQHLAALERRTGRGLDQPDAPLLLAVRSGAQFSMPGTMDTVLDIGLNDETVRGLAKTSGREHFAWDSYRRLIRRYGTTVLGIDEELFTAAAARRHRWNELPELVEDFKVIVKQSTGKDFPQDPVEQLDQAIRAVFTSWNGERARVYRRREHIPDDLGAAVNVQAMVFGNLGPDSGSGVAFTRDPATGRPGLCGDYLPDAQGEDVVAGMRNALPLSELRTRDPESYEQLQQHAQLLEEHYRDLCDLEFTIERGRLWMLQTRVGERTAEAAFRIAAQLVDEGRITGEEALTRVSGAQLSRLLFPRLDETTAESPVMHYFETGEATSPVAEAVAALLRQADAVRRLSVRANADTPEDAARARRFGADGIGLVRTEHMFLGERRPLVEAMILATGAAERQAALDALLPLQRADFAGILTAMGDRPVVIRLLDPPLHEFLPDRTELAVRTATATAQGREVPDRERALLAAMERMHEQDPVLGLRGVRLAFAVPGLVAMQARAIAEAVVERNRAGHAPRVEVMIPLVATAAELRTVRGEVQRVLDEVAQETGTPVSCPIGTMIELPHACDLDSIRFFHEAGLDYVSCSPYRVPIARLEAGRAAVLSARPQPRLT